MEHEGELHHTASDRREEHDTKRGMTPEEIERLVKKQQELDFAHSLFLKGEGPNPYEK